LIPTNYSLSLSEAGFHVPIRQLLAKQSKFHFSV